MSQVRRYVVQFNVTDMPVASSYFRLAFDLVILSDMTAVQIMSEIESRCVMYVQECAGYRPATNKIMFNLITTLFSTNH